MIRPKRMAKLDMYDYMLGYTGTNVSTVRIHVRSINDPTIADISGEIAGNDGFMYVEGHYLKFIEMSIIKIKGIICLDLEVLEI